MATYAERRRLWEEFDRQNPEVFALLRRYALEAKRKGVKVGIRLLIERIRWDLKVQTERPKDAPKLNDWFSSFWARRLMAEVPELDDYFETRERRSPPPPATPPKRKRAAPLRPRSRPTQQTLFGGAA